jgi:hypothetical protein
MRPVACSRSPAGFERFMRYCYVSHSDLLVRLYGNSSPVRFFETVAGIKLLAIRKFEAESVYLRKLLQTLSRASLVALDPS